MRRVENARSVLGRVAGAFTVATFAALALGAGPVDRTTAPSGADRAETSAESQAFEAASRRVDELVGGLPPAALSRAKNRAARLLEIEARADAALSRIELRSAAALGRPPAVDEAVGLEPAPAPPDPSAA